ncbi:MAG: chorismate synthase [Clostridia bacterium]
MSSEWGNTLRISVFGESHGDAIGVTIQGLPAGETIDMEALSAFMSRRKPGKNSLSTPRKEADAPLFLSGLNGDCVNGAPLCAVIENTNTRSKDYSGFENTPRPAHADYTAVVKWHNQSDLRGGGHFSGRLTAPLCIAGGIAKQVLSRQGIEIGAHIRSVGQICDELFPIYPSKELFDAVAKKDFPVLNDEKGQKMRDEILNAKEDYDSVGGTVECAVTGLPPGLGGPLFGGIEGRLASALFGIPAVKGVEFGSGFQGSTCRGSENNDAFCFDEAGNVATVTNHCGGILGGISDGMPVVFNVAFKPTPSIGKPQQTVDLNKKEITEISIGGRHDPCITHRAVPVVEAVAAIVILDLLLTERNIRHGNI